MSDPRMTIWNFKKDTYCKAPICRRKESIRDVENVLQIEVVDIPYDNLLKKKALM